MALSVRFGAVAIGIAAALAFTTISIRRLGKHPTRVLSAADTAVLSTTDLDAEARVQSLRERFQIRPLPEVVAHVSRGRSAPAPHAVIAEGPGTSFAPASEGRVRAVVPEAVRHRVRKTASVELPKHADGTVCVTDDRSGVSIGFKMRGAQPANVATTGDGIALYRNAGPEGGDIVHRVDAEGTEDFVVFETEPKRETLTYDVDASQVPGLRLVNDVLEFLESNGTPALRIAPPYVVGRDGVAHAAHIRLGNCSYDEDARAPWGRPVTAPSSRECEVQIEWNGVKYPALVDPSWSATGSMTTEREEHPATRLPSGAVLVAGGLGTAGYLSSAELFDGVATFTATGSMTTARGYHTLTLLSSGKVLVTGGTATGGTALSSAELFDGTSSFTATGTMTAAREDHMATRLNSGAVLVAGGRNTVYLSTAELFDGTSSFAPTGSMATARGYSTATLLNSGKVLVAGGFTTGSIGLSSAELFDGTSTFAGTGSLAIDRVYHTATLLNSGKVLVAGGYYASTGGGASSAELFDGVSAFAATGAMAQTRIRHSATLLNSGDVLIAGGSGNVIAELFDGATGFIATNNMLSARSAHTATLLNSGNVLLAGGQAPGATTSAVLYVLAAAGTPCVNHSDCAVGTCLEGICCAAACPNGGVCQACTAGTGACTTVVNRDQPDNCTGAMTCSASGSCRLDNGQSATTGADCASGFASDGVCCDTACTGGCDVCTVALGASADGTCTTAPSGYVGAPICTGNVLCNGSQAGCLAQCASDTDCAAADYCGADGACHAQKTQGQACFAAAAPDCKVAGCRVCTTGHCIDGVCCDVACGAQCQACDVTGSVGVCSPVVGAPHGSHPACNGAGGATSACSGTCDGINASACTYPGPTTSCSSACSGSTMTVGACSGQGACVVGSPTACFGNLTCEDNATCKTACTSDGDCVTGYRCTGGACLPRGARCIDDHTSENSAANTAAIPCEPYKCDESSGTCLNQCSSAVDCISPNVCTQSGECVLASGAKSSDSGGCTMSTRAASGEAAWWIAAFVIGVGRWRRGKLRHGRCVSQYSSAGLSHAAASMAHRDETQ